MRLYDFKHSPNPLKVRIALAELGIEYQSIPVNLFKSEHRSPEFSRVNPFSAVPVLQDGEHLLRESNAIIAYLGRKHGTPLWPRSALTESEAFQWLFFESCHLASHCGNLWWTCIVAPALGRDAIPDPAVQASVEDLQESFEIIEAHLARNRYFLGNAYTLVDSSLGTTLLMLRGTPLDDPQRWPSIHQYGNALIDRPSWTAAQGEAIHKFGG
jgi:glutathione S-transferase